MPKCNFIEIVFCHGHSPANLLHLFKYLFLRTPLEGFFWFTTIENRYLIHISTITKKRLQNASILVLLSILYIHIYIYIYTYIDSIYNIYMYIYIYIYIATINWRVSTMSIYHTYDKHLNFGKFYWRLFYEQFVTKILIKLLQIVLSISNI